MYELIISRASPYSIKIQALLGYSGIPHRVRIQNMVSRYRVLKRLTGRTMVPVLRRGEWALNESTEIAAYVMERSARPTLPRARGGALMAWLIEEFADEWMTRWMIQSRWDHEEDTAAVAGLLGRELLGGDLPGAERLGRLVAEQVQARLRPHGLRRENRAALEASATRTLGALEAILSAPPAYLLEPYPTIADFGLYGPLGQYRRDPTGRRHLEAYPAVLDYVRRMDRFTERPPGLPEEGRTDSRALMELQPLVAELLGTHLRVLAAHLAVQDQPRAQDVEARLLDGTLFVARRSSYLQDRLGWILGRINSAYEEGDHLFGSEGLRMESGMMQSVATLTEFPAGRAFLKDYEHLGLH